MDKLGVEIDKNKEREAEKTGKCPRCSAVLINFNPPRCKNCGTEPFEAGTLSGRRSMKDPAVANPPRSDDFDLGGES
jgi:hypothetical protein